MQADVGINLLNINKGHFLYDVAHLSSDLQETQPTLLK